MQLKNHHGLWLIRQYFFSLIYCSPAVHTMRLYRAATPRNGRVYLRSWLFTVIPMDFGFRFDFRNFIFMRRCLSIVTALLWKIYGNIERVTSKKVIENFLKINRNRMGRIFCYIRLSIYNRPNVFLWHNRPNVFLGGFPWITLSFIKRMTLIYTNT